MLNQAGERTLYGAILPAKSSHISTLLSVTFKHDYDLIEFSALSESLVFDFIIKTLNTGALNFNSVDSLPLGVNRKYIYDLSARTLMLNCLTQHYADLWNNNYNDEFRKLSWSITDSRLHPFSTLKDKWSYDIPLRNYFERRQALVEIDVLSAMALGLSINDLVLMYIYQFPVLADNENDTWYDQKGNIVFTCSKGLSGVGIDRPVWEQIRNMKEGETYEHTIEKSELYKGQKVTYYAPFTKCDRIEDYRRAWAHFEKMFR